MDPIANLRKQLEIARVDWTGKETSELSANELELLHNAHIELCELVLGLDQWMRKGGFSPYAKGAR